MFLQVKRRTNEQDQAARARLRALAVPTLFPAAPKGSEPAPGDNTASVTVCPGTTGAWAAIVTQVNIDQVAAGSFASVTPNILPFAGLLRGSWARRSSSSEWTRSLCGLDVWVGANVRSAVAGPGSFRR